MDKKTTIESAIGLVFNDYRQFNHKKIPIQPLPTADLIERCKSKLLVMASDTIRIFMSQNKIDTAIEMREDQVIVDSKLSKRGNYSANLLCTFCNRSTKISGRPSTTSCDWIMSNFTTHLKSCIALKLQEDKVLEIVGTVEPDDSMYTKLKAQIYMQIVKMSNVASKNDETEIKCEVLSPNTDSKLVPINICKINQDGNCLFGAVSHQLFYHKIGSKDHIEATNGLRMKVIEYIKSNMTLFATAIKGRIYDKRPGRKIDNFDVLANSFLESLSTDGFWGGTESIQAIAQIEKANVIIFNEKGEPNMVYNFNPEFEKCVLIAFRLKDPLGEFTNANRNHYDSVVSMDDEVLLTCSKYLCPRQTLEEVNQVQIYEIDD